MLSVKNECTSGTLHVHHLQHAHFRYTACAPPAARTLQVQRTLLACRNARAPPAARTLQVHCTCTTCAHFKYTACAPPAARTLQVQRTLLACRNARAPTATCREHQSQTLTNLKVMAKYSYLVIKNSKFHQVYKRKHVPMIRIDHDLNKNNKYISK